MTEVWKGAAVTAAQTERALSAVARLKEHNVTPALAIVRVGERPDDISYERGAVKRCEKMGVVANCFALPQDAPQGALIELLAALSADPLVHGILLFRPLPKGYDDDAVRAAIAPQKDVDGITDLSAAHLLTGRGPGFLPCTPQACMELLDHYGYDCTGKRAVVVGRSLVVGKPAALLLTGKNATVTLCHTRTADLAARCREAELLVLAAGRAKMIGAECFAPGQVVIDVGINVDAEGKLVGDADFEAAMGVVRAITPVPGGVGAVTTGVLVGHVIEAALRAAGLGFA